VELVQGLEEYELAVLTVEGLLLAVAVQSLGATRNSLG
jgi:hypothetical protein